MSMRFWRSACLWSAVSGALAGQVFIEPAPPGNVQALTLSGTVVPGGAVTLQISGPPFATAYVGFATDSTFEQVAEGTVLIGTENLSFGVELLDHNGQYAFVCPSLPFRPVGDTLFAQVALLSVSGQWTLSNRVRAVYQGNLNSLQIQPLGTFNVNVGGTLRVNAVASGGQGTPVLSVASPVPLPPNMTFDAATGELAFSPDLTQVGTHYVHVSATDAAESVCSQATIVVAAPPPGAPTAVAGVVKDAATLAPLVNVTITGPGGVPSTTTAADGSFTLSGVPAGTTTIVFNGTTAGDYPFLPEPLELIAGVVNVIERPVYLPLLGSQNGVPYAPGGPGDVVVPLPGVPDISLCVAPNSVTTPLGAPFTGNLLLTPVPPTNAPLGLPPGVMPNRLISIQPGGVRFNPPAQLTWANDDNYQPGTVLDIWSVNEQTGQFEKVGEATVQSNGTITTTSGGVVVGSWHYILPPGTGGSSGPEGNDPGGSSNHCTGSWTEASTGIVHEEHTTVPYRTLGVERAVTLHYNSATADTRTLISFDAVIPTLSTVPVKMSAVASVGGVAGLRSYVSTGGLSEGQDETIRLAAQLPLAGAPTGLYDYAIEVANHFSNSTVSTFVNGKAPIVGRQSSEIGVGWAIADVDRLYPQPDGGVLLVRGDGSTLLYGPGSSGSGGLLMRLYDTPAPYSAVQNQFAGLTPGNFTASTATAPNQLVSSYVVPTVNFPDISYDQNAFYNVGPDGVVQGGSATSPAGDDLSFQPPGGNDTFGASFEGYLLVPNGGAVTFTVQVDDGFALRVNGQLVLSHYAGCNYCTFSTTVAGLPAGYVPIRLDLAEDANEADLVLSASGGGLPGGVIPAAYLATSPAGTGTQLVSPAHDFSTLIKNQDGTFTRKLKGGATVHFDAQGYQTSVVDRSGNATTFAYDPAGRLASITDPIGATNPSAGRTTFVYAGANLSQIVGPGPNGPSVTQLAHDVLGRLVAITDPDGSVRSFTYDSAGRLASQTGKNGYVTVYHYDYAGRNTSVTRPDGSTVQVGAANCAFLANPVTGSGFASTPVPAVRVVDLYNDFVDGAGGLLRQRTDAQGRVTKEIDPLGRQTIIQRNAAGLPTTVTGPDGSVTALSYDARGNTTQVVERGNNGPGADDRTWTFAYDPILDVLTSITDPKGNVNSTGVTTRLTYDAFGRPISVRDAADVVTTLAYDEPGYGTPGVSGLLTGLTSASGTAAQSTVRFAYGPTGQLVETTDPELRKSSFAVDGAGYVVASTAQGSSASTSDDQTTSYAYDARRRIVAVTDALGGVTTMSYWPDGALHQVADAKPTPGVTTFSYDPLGRIQSRTDPVGGTETYAYDGDGKLSQFVDRIGRTTAWTYDLGGRPSAKATSGGGASDVVTYGYQPNTDRLSSATDADSNVTLVWNAFGELAQTSTAGSPTQPNTTLTYAYDKNGNRTSMTGIQPGQPNFASVTYVYDALDRLASLADGSTGGTATFSYDARSRRTALVRSVSGQTVRTCYAYNAAGDLTSIEHRSAAGAACGTGQLVSRFDYAYDALGRRASMTENRPAFGIVGGVHAYAYDALNRLVSATHPLDPTETFTYDAVGNRLTSGAAPFSWQYDVANRLLDDGTSTYSYDANGSRATKVETATGATTAYAYDFDNRLKAASIQGATVSVQSYDAMGRRVAATGAGTAPRSYVYDGRHAVVVDEGAVRTRIVYGATIDEPLFCVEGAVKTIPCADGLGSITELVLAPGFIGRASRYSAFGVQLAMTGTDFCPLAFAGREFDGVLGASHLRSRHFDPTVGRFIQQDPAGIDGGDLNLYAYALNNPISLIDPSGLSCVYSQTNGTLVCTGDDGEVTINTDQGYSGKGDGFINNPSAQNQKNKGPIPQGTYTIGQPNNRKGPLTFPLTPDPNNEMFDRDGFLIHGDNRKGDRSASEGCIILPRGIREKLKPGETVIVVP